MYSIHTFVNTQYLTIFDYLKTKAFQYLPLDLTGARGNFAGTADGLRSSTLDWGWVMTSAFDGCPVAETFGFTELLLDGNCCPLLVLSVEERGDEPAGALLLSYALGKSGKSNKRNIK